ncbi:MULTISPECIES: hypothetical protein [unclassified Halomonas]|uniref:hypothetical protein n=1 Tax=unclassified Halomonas TaxID=2609666 RepID=UPI001CF0F8E3|nr:MULTISPECIES: hypothetical protein [unclassified Halomonas]MCA8864946.1 hypothetical protein [Halomonas sp. SBBP1]UZH11657.1 hypothetical protein OM794_07935 [Halomonas sp. BDJS001]
MSTSPSTRLGAMMLLIASLAGLAIALYAYFTPLTGVNGTLGAMVAILACLALTVMSLLLFKVSGRGVSITLRVLILIGLAGTFFAAMLLHQWWICVAMVIGLIGLLLDMVRPSHHARATHT